MFIIGEDVAEAGTPFKVLAGLVKEFGTERVIDSPISEAGIAGIGVGAAMTGMRPVVDIMFGDFLTLTMDQLVNQAAKIHYMSGGKLKVPLVLRTTLGATRRSAAQHCQSLARLGEPYSRLEGRGSLHALRRQGSAQKRYPRRQPRGLLRRQDDVPAERAGAAGGIHDSPRRRRREAGGQRHHAGCHEQHGASGARSGGNRSQAGGISAEVVDVRTTAPLDKQTLIESAKKTSRAIVVDEGYEALRRHRGNCVGDRRWRVLLSRCAGETHGRDGRAGAVLARARRSNRTDAGKCRGNGEDVVQQASDEVRSKGFNGSNRSEWSFPIGTFGTTGTLERRS